MAAALVAAICASEPAVAGATADAGLPEDLSENPLDATSVRFCWAGPDEGSEYDSWTIRIARGAKPPPADAPVAATLPQRPDGVCYTAAGLVTDEAYTFRLTGHNVHGEGPPAFHTFAARIPGTFVLDGGSLERFPVDTYRLQLAVTANDRHWHALFTDAVRDENGTALARTFYSTRRKNGWTRPDLVVGGHHAVLAANASTVAVTWSDELRRFIPRYRLKAPHATEFGPRRFVAHADRHDRVVTSALDGRGHLHVLSYGRRMDGGAIYDSNGSGRWREQVIPAAWGCDWFSPCPAPPLLTYDAVRDRIVVVSQGANSVRVASKRASAAKFGRLRALSAVNDRHLIATSLASRAGHVTLGLATKPGPDQYEEPTGPFYVYAGRRLVRVPGTTANDRHLLVAASSANRVKLAWRRFSPAWDRSEQGIWTAESVRNPRTGRWSIRNLSHRSDSHYDELHSLTVTAAGRPLIGYRRVGPL